MLWSNESAGAANGLYFASHVDGAGDTAASWAGTRLCATTLCPDDHLNIKSIDADASGNLYAAVKTSKNDASTPNPDDPLIVVYRLNLNGTWTHSTAWQVKDDVTRVIILLDSTNHEAHLFGAGPCCSGGTVYTKNAPLGTLAFPAGIGTPFIKSSQDPKINNTTSTKQTVNSTTGLLVLAGDDSTRFYVHNYMTIRGGDTTAPTVTAVGPADKATGQVGHGQRHRHLLGGDGPGQRQHLHLHPLRGDGHGTPGRRRHAEHRRHHRHAEPDGRPQGRDVLHGPGHRREGPRG